MPRILAKIMYIFIDCVHLNAEWIFFSSAIKFSISRTRVVHGVKSVNLCEVKSVNLSEEQFICHFL